MPLVVTMTTGIVSLARLAGSPEIQEAIAPLPAAYALVWNPKSFWTILSPGDDVLRRPGTLALA